MIIAVIKNIPGGFGDWAEAAEVGVVCLGLLFAGPGKYSLKIG